MSEQKFFICPQCKNMVGIINDGGMPLICCGEEMQQLTPNTSDGATEKHVPDISVKERLVHVVIGSVPHPMTQEHHIDFIYLQTAHGGQMKRIALDNEASVMFAVLNDEPVAAYAYCNLHGLWKSDISTQTEQTHCLNENDNEEDEKICSAEFSQGCMS